MKRIPPGTVVPQGTHGVFSRMMDGPPHYDHVDLWNRDFKVPEDSWVQWYYDGPKSDILLWRMPAIPEWEELARWLGL